MLSASECLLKATNFEMAARMAPPEERMVYVEQAVHWRRLAHEIHMERFGPFGSANTLPGEAGVRDRRGDGGPDPGMAD